MKTANYFYLGLNLSEKDIEKLRKRAEEHIKKQIEELKTNVFNFLLTEKKIEQLNEYSDQIKIRHLDRKDCRYSMRISFTTQSNYKLN